MFASSIRFGSLGAVLIGLCGCNSPGRVAGVSSAEREQRARRAYVYYLDGAGGGGVLVNWSGGVRDGLLDGGYTGWGETFVWETGLGVVADQTADNAYKRRKASELAKKIVAYKQANPYAPVTLIGLSAGTAIAVFTLEALPPGVSVQDVVLLSGSLSSNYDFSAALERVDGKVYITTSQRDTVLGALLPLAGTANRGSGTTRTIGIEGPDCPGDLAQRQRYHKKVVVVPWQPAFARYGNHGGHTDTVSAPFIEKYVAPLVVQAQATDTVLTSSAPEGLVRNPTYDRWARFAPGSWVLYAGSEKTDGEPRPLYVRTTLLSKTSDVAVVQRERVDENGQPISMGADETLALNEVLYHSAFVEPEEQPTTHPATTVRSMPPENVMVGDQPTMCRVEIIDAQGDFSTWGQSPRAKLHLSDEVPGGLTQIQLTTTVDGKPVSVEARAVAQRALAG